MAKWLCIIIAILIMFPFGMNEEKEMEKDVSIGNFNGNMQFYSCHSSHANYSPVALMKEYCYEGIVGKAIVFDASSSYDPNGDALQYRWDFDNDGVWDTKWLSSPIITYAYHESYNGYVKLQVSDGKFTDECIARVLVKNADVGDVDQKQEKADDFVKIYGDKFYAQSFKPSKCGFDGIDLLIARHGLTGKILKQIFGEWINMLNLFLGDLVVAVYGELGDIFTDENVRNSLIFETRIKAEEIERKEKWIHISFDVELHWNKTYYIVVYQEGGNEFNYYKWYYGIGDPYKNGSFYSEENYNWQWQEDSSRDFCFRTYAYTSGEEPDGIVERWAVLLGCLEVIGGKTTKYADQNAYDMRDCLVAHGWDASHIKILISPTKSQVKDAIEWLDSVDDSDDIDLVMWTSHGGSGGDISYYMFAVKDSRVYGYEMDSWLDQCGAEGICVIAESCQAGWAIDDLAKDGRVILTASDREHSAGPWDPFQNSVFIYYLVDFSEGAFPKKSLDKNGDGWVSAEEAYPYARDKTNAFSWEYGGFFQNPLIYDGYEGELKISYVG